MTIWKFPLRVTDDIALTLPRGAEILCVQTQAGKPYVWAKVDPTAEKVVRWLRLFGTGHPVEEVGRYIGTFQLEGGALVFHLFEADTGMVDQAIDG